MITIMIVSSLLPFLFLYLPQTKSPTIRHLLTTPLHRSDRKRVRTLQVRRLRSEGLRRAELALVRGAAHLLRAVARDGFPRGVLPAEQRRGLHAGRLLQLHTPQEPQRRARPRAGAQHEEVAEDEGQGREERESESEPGTDEEEILGKGGAWSKVADGTCVLSCWLVGACLLARAWVT